MVSFFVRKASTLAWRRCAARVSFSSSPCSVWCCTSRSVTCCWSAAATGQRLAGQVLAAERERLAALVLQLGGLALELVQLQFQALAGGRHVGDAAAHLLQQLQLLLVRVVEGLARILGPVKGLVRLRAEDHPHPLHDTAHGLRAPPSDGL